MKKLSKIFNNLGSSILFAFTCFLVFDFIIFKFFSTGVCQIGSLTYGQVFIRLISAGILGGAFYFVEKNRQKN